MRKTLLLLPCATIFAFAANLMASENPSLKAVGTPHFMSDSDPIVETQPLGKDYLMVVKESKGGGFYKTVESVKIQKTILPPPIRKNTHYNTGAGNSEFFESFEGWDGVTPNWIPENWTEQNSSEELVTLQNGSFTWHTIAAANDKAPAAPCDGDNYAIIYHAAYKDSSGKKVELSQDEWLISPTVAVNGGETFSFYLAFNPLYLFNVNNEYIDWIKNDFIERVPSTTMKIYVREENGEWQMLKDVYDDWTSVSFTDLFEKYSGSEFRYYEFPLNAYAGKKVQFAFRFVGKWGNTMELDAVKVAVPNTQASYIRPAGAFFYGLSEDYKSISDDEGNGVMLVPASTDLTWTNTSSDAADTFEWTYSDPTNPEKTTTSSERNLVVNYPASNEWYQIPTLKAEATGAISSEYKWKGYGLQAGGDASKTTDGATIKYGVGNYDLSKGYFLLESYQTPIVGYNQNADMLWRMTFGMTGSGQKIHLYALGNLVAKPTHPYVLSSLRIHGEGEIADDAVLSVAVYRTSAQGAPIQIIAQGECRGSEIINTNLDGKQVLTLPFALKSYDAATQTTTDDPIVVSDGLLIYFTGFDNAEKVTSFAAYQSKDPADNDECNAIMYFQTTVNGEASAAAYPMNVLQYAGVDCNSSFLFTLDAAYPYLSYDGESIAVSQEGGEKTIELNSFYNASEWTIMENADWLSCKPGEGKQLIISAEPMASAQSRDAEITISAPTVSTTIKVIQSSNGGLSNVESTLSVLVADGCFIVSNGNDSVSSVDIYNASGIKQVSAALSTGSNRISAESVSNGVYILKFNDGTTLKVVK